MSDAGVVIVGASYAGLQMASTARALGYQGPIRLIGEESMAPYQRPPLSKQFLAGGMAASVLPLKSEDFYTQQGIELLPDARVVSIDRDRRVVETARGERIPYRWLGLATGARPRPLHVPDVDLDGVYELRTLEHARALRAALRPDAVVVVIGGGFIGLEAAATARGLGCRVTVVEAGDRLLARALSPRMASYLEARHRAEGIDIRLSSTAERIDNRGGRVGGVTLRDGTTLEADLVVVGIGVLPNSELAERAGIRCANGILVDRNGQSSDPSVFAAGDCACHAQWTGGPLRLESVQNANDQGRAAGAAIAGQPKPYGAVPWFWSDQFGIKLQMAGLSAGHDQVVMRGEMEEGRFSLFYFRQGVLIAADSVNRAGEHMAVRRLLAAAVPLRPEQAADAQADLKALVPRA
ncbi:MAG: FAD-dependent oxidoreductase [Aquisalimonadaceae bacterium]